MNKSIVLLALFLVGPVPPPFAAAERSERVQDGPVIDTVETEQLHSMLTAQRDAEVKAKASGEAPPVPGFVIVDVRTDTETEVSIIPGAITKAAYEKNAKKYRDRTVIPYCLTGGRSKRYAEQLAGDGVKVKNYEGSILAWVGDGLPLVTLDGESTHRVYTFRDRDQVPAKYEQITQ